MYYIQVLRSHQPSSIYNRVTLSPPLHIQTYNSQVEGLQYRVGGVEQGEEEARVEHERVVRELAMAREERDAARVDVEMRQVEVEELQRRQVQVQKEMAGELEQVYEPHTLSLALKHAYTHTHTHTHTHSDSHTGLRAAYPLSRKHSHTRTHTRSRSHSHTQMYTCTRIFVIYIYKFS